MLTDMFVSDCRILDFTFGGPNGAFAISMDGNTNFGNCIQV